MKGQGNVPVVRVEDVHMVVTIIMCSSGTGV